MRSLIWIPMLILAGLAFFTYTRGPVQPAQGPLTYVSGSVSTIRAAQAYLLPIADPVFAPVRDSAIADPVLDANAALLYHVESDRWLFEKNPTAKVPIASLTKLLTAMVVYDLFTGTEVVTVASGSVRVDGVTQTLNSQERLAVGDLVAMMLVQSSNDAAYALADYARGQGIDLVAKMNEKAWLVGMRSCTFSDPAGLDDTAFCTAADLLRLVRTALSSAPQLWPVMASPSLTIRSADGSTLHEVRSTNELLDEIPRIVGGKTGNTDGALGCMLLVVKSENDSDTLVSIVLGSRARFQDTRTLIGWATIGYRWH